MVKEPINEKPSESLFQLNMNNLEKTITWFFINYFFTIFDGRIPLFFLNNCAYEMKKNAAYLTGF